MIKNILSEQFKDLISEETLAAIEESFKQAVEEKSKEKIQLEKENTAKQLDEAYAGKLSTIVEKIDADHTTKLKKLVEAIDMDHAVKLQKLVKGIDSKHTAALEKVLEKHNTELNKKSVNFQQNLVEEISNYLDLYVDKHLPKDQISEAVANIKAKNQLNQIRQIVGVSEEFIDGEIKEALVDGKATIDSLRNELNQALKENVQLEVRTNKAESRLLLDEKTADMPSAKKKFVAKLLSNKNPNYIQENFDYVVEMFERENKEEVESTKETVRKDFVKAPVVDRPSIIEEKKNFNNNEIERNESSSEGVSGYLNEMKKLEKHRFVS